MKTGIKILVAVAILVVIYLIGIKVLLGILVGGVIVYFLGKDGVKKYFDKAKGGAKDLYDEVVPKGVEEDLEIETASIEPTSSQGINEVTILFTDGQKMKSLQPNPELDEVLKEGAKVHHSIVYTLGVPLQKRETIQVSGKIFVITG